MSHSKTKPTKWSVHPAKTQISLVGWLCWGLTSQSTIFQSCRDGAIPSWVINQYFRGVKCLAQGHNTAAVGLEPRTSRSGVRHSTTETPRSPKSAWASAQPDQSLRWPHEEAPGPWLLIEHTANTDQSGLIPRLIWADTQADLGWHPGWSESSLDAQVI